MTVVMAGERGYGGQRGEERVTAQKRGSGGSRGHLRTTSVAQGLKAFRWGLARCRVQGEENRRQDLELKFKSMFSRTFRGQHISPLV